MIVIIQFQDLDRVSLTKSTMWSRSDVIIRIEVFDSVLHVYMYLILRCLHSFDALCCDMRMITNWATIGRRR